MGLKAALVMPVPRKFPNFIIQDTQATRFLAGSLSQLGMGHRKLGMGDSLRKGRERRHPEVSGQYKRGTQTVTKITDFVPILS